MQIYIYLAVYIVFIIGLSIYISKSSTADDFLIAGRNSNTLSILFSKFSGAIGVSTFITFTGFAYKFGWGFLAMSLGSIVGYLFFAFWAAPRVKQLSSKGLFYTQGDLPAYVTGDDRTGLVTNVITVVVQFFWILLGLAGGAKIISYFELFSYETALLLTAAVVMIYVLVSGYKAVIATDILQGGIILVFLGILIFGLFDTSNLNSVLSTTPPESVKIGKIIGLILYGTLSVFGLADRYQLCYAAKDERSLTKGMGFAIIPVLIIVLLLLVIGLYTYSQAPGLDPDTAFIFAMEHFVNQSWLPLLFILFFAGLMSTADTSIFAVASHVTYKSAPGNKVKNVRYITVITVIIACAVAWFWRSIVDITIVGAALRMCTSVAMIYVIGNNTNNGRFLGSALGGIIGLIAGLAAFGTTPKIAIAVLIGSLLGLLFKSKPKQTAK